MAKEKILVVEDDTDIQELITYNLKKEGFQVKGVISGEEALASIEESIPNIVVLDLMLPGVDGLEVCRQLKRDPKTQEISIIMLTAKGEETDIVTGLELGADDYITKPFSPRVLLARIRSVMRRKTVNKTDEQSTLRIHDLIIHPGRHEVLVNERRVDLTPTEFRLLHLLARRPGWVYTRYQIVNALHGEDYPVTDRSVDVQCAGLRKKMGKAGKYIETVRGVGYRFQE